MERMLALKWTYQLKVIKPALFETVFALMNYLPESIPDQPRNGPDRSHLASKAQRGWVGEPGRSKINYLSFFLEK